MATVKSQPTTGKLSKNETRIANQLAEAEQRIRFLDLLVGLSGFVIFTVVFALLFVYLDHRLSLAAGLRQTFLVGYLLFSVGYLYYTVVRPFRRRVNPFFAAGQIEENLEGSRNSLINWLDFQREKEPNQVVRGSLNKRAARDLKRIDVEEAIVNRRAGKLGLVAGVLLFVLATVFLVMGPRIFLHHLGRAFFPFSFRSTVVPTSTSVTILRPQGGNAVIPVGQSLTITAEVSGQIPKKGDPDAPRLRLWYQPGEPPVTRKMEPSVSSSEWEVTLPSDEVRNGFFYRVEAGDGRTPDYQITVRATPLISEFRARYDYRKYLGRTHEVRRERKIESIQGTEITLWARTNRRIQDAYLEVEIANQRNNIRAEILPNDPHAFEAKFTLKQDGFYRLHYTSIEGETYADPQYYSITARPDSAPHRVELTDPGQDITLPANGVLRLAGEARDDIGVKSLTLHMHVVDGAKFQDKPYRPEKDFRLTGGGYPRRLEYKDFVDLKKVKDDAGAAVTLREGMVLEYWLEAADACDQPKPNVAESKRFKVTLLPPDRDEENQQQDRQQAQDEQQQHEQQQDQQLEQESQDRQDDAASQNEKNRQNEAAQDPNNQDKEGEGSEGNPNEDNPNEDNPNEDNPNNQPKDNPNEQPQDDQAKEEQRKKDEETRKQAEKLKDALENRDKEENKPGEGKGEDKPNPAESKGKPRDDKPNEGEESEGKPKEDGDSEGKPSDAKDQGTMKPEDNPGESKDQGMMSEGEQPSEGKDAPPMEGAQEKPGEGKSDNKQPTDSPATSKGGDPDEGDPEQETKPSEEKPTEGDPMAEPGKCKNCEGMGDMQNSSTKPNPNEAEGTSKSTAKGEDTDNPMKDSVAQAKPGKPTEEGDPSKGKPTQEPTDPDEIPSTAKQTPSDSDEPGKREKLDPENITPEQIEQLAKNLKENLQKGDLDEAGKEYQDLNELMEKVKDPKVREALEKAMKENGEVNPSSTASSKKDPTKGQGDPSDVKDQQGSGMGMEQQASKGKGKGEGEGMQEGDPSEGKGKGEQEGTGDEVAKGTGKPGGGVPNGGEDRVGGGPAPPENTDPALAQPASDLQLKKFLEEVDPNILADAQMTPEEYAEFLKRYKDLAARDLVNPPEPIAPPQNTGNLPGVVGQPTTTDPGQPGALSPVGRPKPPPGYREAYKEFLRQLGRPAS